MNESYNIKLTFYSKTNDLMTITIPRANKSISAETATEGMNAIIASAIVMTSAGEPWVAKSAELLTTKTDSFVA